MIGAEVSLIPQIGEVRLSESRSSHPIWKNESLAESRFPVLRGSAWSAAVSVPVYGIANAYALDFDSEGNAKIFIDTESTIKVALRDPEGVPVVGIEVALNGPNEKSKPLSTDREGRVQFIAKPSTDYWLSVEDSAWRLLGSWSNSVTLRPEEYELTVAKSADIWLCFGGLGSGWHRTVLVACYSGGIPERMNLSLCTPFAPVVRAHVAVKRMVVVLVGFKPAEIPVDPGSIGTHESIDVTPILGMTFNVPRSSLPQQTNGPLQATATPLEILKEHLGIQSKNEHLLWHFGSTFTPPEGDIVFGPFTPGTYELKILDATGAVVWQQTKTIE
jgi:hypothetical protein